MRFYLSFNLKLLKKNYCAVCGSRLKVKIKTAVVYEKELFINKKINRIYGVYHCDKCGYDISYFYQKKLKSEKNSDNINLKQVIKKYSDK